MLQCCSFSFTFAMKQFTFTKLQFLFCICRKNLIHRVCSVAMYLSDHEESACNAGDPGPIPWSGRSPGWGTGSPLQYSSPGNFPDPGIESRTSCRAGNRRPDIVRQCSKKKTNEGSTCYKATV